MEIIKINPQGFCKGVTKAIYMINKALNDENVKRPIYMLGNIVHNQNIVQAFKNKGIIILNGNSRLDMLDQIKEGTVIFTAHGVSDAVKRKAVEKGLDIIDATCRDVEKTHQIIKQKLDEGYKVLFYGKENHPETEGVIGLSDEIIVVNDNTNINNLEDYFGKMILTTQTTMSYLDVLHFYDLLKEKYPQIILLEEVCSATRKRQSAVIDIKDNIDLCIVVGDPLSNNSKMLKEVAEKKANLKTLLIENVEGLKDFDFTNYHRIGITAGASTPDAIVEEIIEVLKSNNKVFISKLQDEDFLK